MEKESRNDWKRTIALLAIIFGVIFLGIILFGSGNALTGAATVESSPSALIEQTWLVSLVGITLLIVGGIALFKLNN